MEITHAVDDLYRSHSYLGRVTYSAKLDSQLRQYGHDILLASLLCSAADARLERTNI